MLKLADLNFEQIVRESEEPETCTRNFRSAAGTSAWGGIVENFSASSFLSLSSILMPACPHLHHRRADVGKRGVAASRCQGS